jgi:hypothetical protein
MAYGDQFSVTTGKLTLTAAATKSLWLLNPVTNKFRLTYLNVSLDASAAAAAVQIDIYRVVTIGSAAGTAGSENPLDPSSQAATTTSLTALSTEPTTVTVLDSWYVQPLGGLLVIQNPLGREYVAAAAGARIGLRYTTAAGVTPDCLATVYFEE